MKAFLLAAAATLVISALSAPAHAGAPVSLRMDTTDADGRITLGDLFDGVSGPAANIVVAARMGPTAVLEAGQVQVSARRAGFDWTNSNGIRRIIVREGQDNGGVSAGGKTLAGAARANVEVLAYARSIMAGEIGPAPGPRLGKDGRRPDGRPPRRRRRDRPGRQAPPA